MEFFRAVQDRRPFCKISTAGARPRTSARKYAPNHRRERYAVPTADAAELFAVLTEARLDPSRVAIASAGNVIALDFDHAGQPSDPAALMAWLPGDLGLYDYVVQRSQSYGFPDPRWRIWLVVSGEMSLDTQRAIAAACAPPADPSLYSDGHLIFTADPQTETGAPVPCDGPRYELIAGPLGGVVPLDSITAVLSAEPIAAAPERHVSVEPGGRLTIDEVRRLLSAIPATDFSTRPEWLQIIMATHSATGGSDEGLDAVIAWSATDPAYADHAPDVETAWRSLKPDGGVGVGTLMMYGRRYGAVTSSVHVTAGLDALDVLPECAGLSEQIAAMRGDSTDADVLRIIARLLPLDELAVARAITALHSVTGRKINDLKAALRAARKAAKQAAKRAPAPEDDIPRAIAQRIAEAHAGQLIHATDEQFWRYEVTHWRRVPDNEMTGAALNAIREYEAQTGEVVGNAAATIGAIKTVLTGDTFQRVSLLDREPTSVINCLNAEVHVKPCGALDVRPHSPESWLSHVLPIEYDPAAVCPTFDRVLLEIFCGDEEVARHFCELLGYSIQARKDVATIVAMVGPSGANGKSTLLDLAAALCGPGYYPQSLAALSEGKNNHALSGLAGKLIIADDDVKKNFSADDALLKSISENKKMTVNPKGRPEFQIVSTATLWLASNHYPHISDSTEGLLRRMHVFGMNARFDGPARDPGIAKRIIDTELPGVLLRVLRAYSAFRQRGSQWIIPDACARALRAWRTESNPWRAWYDSAVIEAADRTAPLRELYGDYSAWMMDNGTGAGKLSRTRFAQDLRARPGITIAGDAVTGVALRGQNKGDW